MERRQFEHLVDRLHDLTRRQREKLLALIAEGLKRERTAKVIEQAVRERLNCPRCGASNPYRHGHADGLQRYRCAACGKTFNGLTCTQLARLRHKGRWLDYLACMLVM
jgi:transposase-like protein